MKRILARWTAALLLCIVLFGTNVPTGWAQTGPIAPSSHAAASVEEAEKVHLILTGQTGSGLDIGPSCRADLCAVQATFSAAFQGRWESRLEVHPLFGSAWTAGKVRAYLADLKIGANDVVVFYHAGHGGILNASDPVNTHMLSMHTDNSNLSRGEIRKLLGGQGRGLVLLSDACSSTPKLPGLVRSHGTSTDKAASLNLNNIRNLFLRFRGLVDITAAEVGTVAGNNKGGNFAGARGAFTVAFLRGICQDRVYAGWTEFFPVLRDMTRQCSAGAHQAQAFAIEEGAAASHATAAPSMPVTGPIGRR